MTTKLTFLKRLTATTLILGLSAGTALAKDGKTLKFDTDGDGQVTISEFQAGVENRFTAADTNADGFLSDDERQAAREARRTRNDNEKFARTDLNGDGQISKDELDQAEDAKRARIKAGFDLNGDGTIDEAEKEQFHAKRAQRDAKDEAGKGRLDEKRFNPDVNEDGFISRDEHSAAATKMFTFLDANGDGVLTEGEGHRRKKKKGKKGKRKGFGS